MGATLCISLQSTLGDAQAQEPAPRSGGLAQFGSGNSDPKKNLDGAKDVWKTTPSSSGTQPPSADGSTGRPDVGVHDVGPPQEVVRSESRSLGGVTRSKRKSNSQEKSELDNNVSRSGRGVLQPEDHGNLRKPQSIPTPEVFPPSPSPSPSPSGPPVDVSAPSKSLTYSDEEIFSKVFKKKQVVQNLQVPVFYESSPKSIGNVTLHSNLEYESGKFAAAVNCEEIFKYLEGLVDPLYLRRELIELEVAKKDLKKWVPLIFFSDSAYQVIYDESKLRISILVPPEARKLQVQAIQPFMQMTPEGELVRPSNLSAQVTGYANQEFRVYQASKSLNTSERAPFQTQFNSAVNLLGWVLESNAFYQEKRPGSTLPSWIRQDVRLVKDYPSIRVRQSIGDLIYPTDSVQVFQPLGGIDFATVFQMQANRINYPSGEEELFLKRPSKVQVFINNQQRQILELPAGRHALKNFPVFNGVNQVKLVITDDLGQEETLNFIISTGLQLLAPGVQQVNYAIGYPSTQVSATKVYDTNNPIFSGFHRVGVSNSLTLGVNSQAKKDQVNFGLNAVLGTNIGVFSIESMSSRVRSSRPGYYLKLNYLYFNQGVLNQTANSGYLSVMNRTSVNFGVLGSTPEFYSFGIFRYNNPVIYNGYLNLTAPLSDKFLGTLSASYSLNRVTRNPQDSSQVANYSYGLTLSEVFQNAMASINIRVAKLATNMTEKTITINLNWRLDSKQFVSASYETMHEAISTNYNYNSLGSYSGRFLANAGYQKNETQNQARINLNYWGSRGIVGGNYQYIDQTTSSTFTNSQSGQNTSGTNNVNSQDSNHSQTQLINLRVSSSLVYAGGQFALSRPVTDSFVIAKAIKSAEGERILVNPAGEGQYMAASGFLGPAVVPEVASYYYMPLRVVAPDSGIGVNILNERFTVFPTYKSGFIIRVGEEQSVLLVVHLVSPKGESIGADFGEIRSIDFTDGPKTPIFTNRNGKLVVQGLAAGRYEVELFSGKWRKVIVEIPEGSTNILDLGKVVIQGKANE